MVIRNGRCKICNDALLAQSAVIIFIFTEILMTKKKRERNRKIHLIMNNYFNNKLIKKKLQVSILLNFALYFYTNTTDCDVTTCFLVVVANINNTE